MIRPNVGKTADKYGPVRGVPGATNKPLPPVYKQSPQYMGPFVQGANQQTRMMGWDGVREQPRPRDPKSDGVPPAQMINPLGKVGGGGALPSMTAKQRPPQQTLRQQPVQQPMYQHQPVQQPMYQPQPTNQQRPQPVSMQNFIQPMNQPAARVPTAPQPQPTKQPIRSPLSAQPPRQMAPHQQAPQTLPTRQQPQAQPQQQAPPRNELLEAIRKEMGELQQQVEQMKDNTDQIYELQDSLGKLIQKVESIEWDSFSFEADVSVPGGVDVWEELPSDTMDVNFQSIRPNQSPRKIFKEGERIRVHYPLAEFNVEMPDGSLQKWRFGRARIFKSDGWLLDDVYFPLEISASSLIGADQQNPDFSLITTVSNIRV